MHMFHLQPFRTFLIKRDTCHRRRLRVSWRLQKNLIIYQTLMQRAFAREKKYNWFHCTRYIQSFFCNNHWSGGIHTFPAQLSVDYCQYKRTGKPWTSASLLLFFWRCRRPAYRIHIRSVWEHCRFSFPQSSGAFHRSKIWQYARLLCYHRQRRTNLPGYKRVDPSGPHAGRLYCRNPTPIYHKRKTSGISWCAAWCRYCHARILDCIWDIPQKQL